MNPCQLVRQSCMEYGKTEICQSYVTIHPSEIPSLVQQIIQQYNTNNTNSKNETVAATNSGGIVEWDEEDWHYRCKQIDDIVNTSKWPKSIRIERIALYILALDSINFSFWTTTTTNEHEQKSKQYEYDDLAITLKNMAQSDHILQQRMIDETITKQDNTEINPTFQLSKEYIFSPQNLQSMTIERMEQLFKSHHPKSQQLDDYTNNTFAILPPNLNVRCRIWNEIGNVLMQSPFNGSAMSLLDMVPDKSAPKYVQLLIDNFPNFRDDTIALVQNNNNKSMLHEQVPIDGSSSLLIPELYFYKRAQICIGDLNAALVSEQLIESNFNNMDDITTFADYRVPQLLRHYNIIQYSNYLSNKVDNYIEIEINSHEEYAIRASTVVAVELIVQELHRYQQEQQLCAHGSDSTVPNNNMNNKTTASCATTSETFHWNAIQTDWYLWQVGEKMNMRNELLPHHRVRTTFY